MCQTIEEITEEHIIVQDLDKYIAKNGDTQTTLVMRVLRRNYISDIQIKQDLQPLIKCNKESPSISWMLKNKTVKTVASVSFVLFSSYLVCRVLETVVGLDKLLMAWMP